MFEREGFAPFAARYSQWSVLMGKHIVFDTGSDDAPEEVSGLAKGVGEDGRLEVEVEGVSKKFLVGEIRGVREAE